jgi:CCR4-NOT transcription complex subunit 4
MVCNFARFGLYFLLMIIACLKVLITCTRGTRAPNGQQTAASIPCANGPSKLKTEAVSSSTLAFSSAVAGTTQASTLHGDAGKRPTLNEEIQTTNAKSKPESLKSLNQHISMDFRTNPTEKFTILDGTCASLTLSNEASCPPASKDNDRGINMPPDITDSAYHTGHSCGSVPEKLGVVGSGQIQNLCSDMSLISIDGIARDEHSGVVRPNSSLSDPVLIKAPVNQGLQQQYAEQYTEPSITTVGKASASINGVYALSEKCDWRSDSHGQAAQDNSSEVEDDVLSFDSQRLKDPEVVSRSTYLPNSANSLHASRSHPLQHSEAYGAVRLNADHPISLDNRVSDSPLLHSSSISVISNGFPENLVSNASVLDRSFERSILLPNEERRKQMGRFLGDVANGDNNAAMDKGESSIISNILSMDYPWDETLASPQNLVKLLSERDQQSSSLKTSSSWKPPNNNQSRFSFARHEESKNHAFDVQPSFNAIEQFPKSRSFSQDFAERDLYMDRFGIGNGFSSRNFEESEILTNSHPIPSSNKLSGESCFRFLEGFIYIL